MSLTPLAIGTQPLVPTESVQASAQSQTTVPTSSTPLAAAKQPPSSDAAPLSAITNNVSLGSQAVRRSGRQVASSLEPPKKTTGKRVHETSALAKAVQTRSGRVVQVPQANKRPKK
ncbi:hypothetical protein CPB86DRAFT_792086 [Serendipita vermifera]|nr:hypothetical protein CPB86DRAFT_792086 [Serendipita vermifera]